jgi:hypothetical protein
MSEVRLLLGKNLKKCVYDSYALSSKKRKEYQGLEIQAGGLYLGKFNSFLKVFWQILIHNMPSQQKINTVRVNTLRRTNPNGANAISLDKQKRHV